MTAPAPTVFLTADQILQPRPLPVEEGSVPEWGGPVRGRGLSASERDAFEATVVRQKGKDIQINRQNLRARLVAMSLVGEDGKTPLIKEEQIPSLSTQSAAVIERIFEVCQKLSGLAPADV